MNTSWAIRLSAQHAGELGALRCVPGVAVHEAGDTLWLCGEDLDTLDRLELQRLPTSGRFCVGPGRQLVPIGKRLPVGALPEQPWVALSRWMEVESPPAALAGRVERRVLLGLRPCGVMKEPNLLITSLDEAARWADTALSIRLSRLKAAVEPAQRQIVFRGAPLPAVPGPRYVVEHGIALPAGYAFDLALTRQDAAELLGLSGREIAVFDRDANWTILPGEALSAVTRSTLRSFVGSPTRPDEEGGDGS